MGFSALVTGASGAIGSAIARSLEEKGLQVFWHCFQNNCQTFPDRVLRADLRDESAVEKIFSDLEYFCGGVDVLINNAGVSLPQKLITDTSSSEFDSIFETNVRSAFLCCRAAIPSMVKKKMGRIINISSIWGVSGGSCEVAYAASKAALIGLTHSLAKELAPSGITVNAIAPGLIESPMNGHFIHQTRAQLLQEIPCGSFGTPQNIAHAVCYFVDELANFVTGQTLLLDGGWI